MKPVLPLPIGRPKAPARRRSAGALRDEAINLYVSIWGLKPTCVPMYCSELLDDDLPF